MTDDGLTLCSQEPSDAAWRRAGAIAAQILINLAERDARAEAQRITALAT